MRLFFSKTKRLLHATGSGGGFHPGATESAKPAEPPPAATGRHGPPAAHLASQGLIASGK
jgi:hypothetical protein